jgi:hypothetical protein
LDKIGLGKTKRWCGVLSEVYRIVNAVGKLLTEQINTVIAAGENAKVILRSLFPMQYNVLKLTKTCWKAILLTGGLGYSPHLFQALQNITYPGTTKPEIIVPVDGRGAIVRIYQMYLVLFIR